MFFYPNGVLPPSPQSYQIKVEKTFLNCKRIPNILNNPYSRLMPFNLYLYLHWLAEHLIAVQGSKLRKISVYQ